MPWYSSSLPRYIIRRRRIYSFEVVYDKIRGFGSGAELGNKFDVRVRVLIRVPLILYKVQCSAAAAAVTSKKSTEKD